MQAAIIIAFMVLTVITGIGSRYFTGKPDNVVEEIAEDIIEKQTGYKIDLSPFTPEIVDKDLPSPSYTQKEKEELEKQAEENLKKLKEKHNHDTYDKDDPFREKIEENLSRDAADSDS